MIQDELYTGIDMTSVVEVMSYIATQEMRLSVQVKLLSVAGGGNYTAYLTQESDGGGVGNYVVPAQTYLAGAGAQHIWFQFETHVRPTDVIHVFVLGQAGDNNRSVRVRLWDESTVWLVANRSLSDFANLISLLDRTQTLVTRILNGPGAICWPLLIECPAGTPVETADVWVTTDIAGMHLVWRGYTNTNGYVYPWLDLGTYYSWKQKSGCTFTNPELFVVL